MSTRGEQLLALRKLHLPNVESDGAKIAGASLKSVLRAIDDHAGEKGSCWATVDSIALETCLSDKTVRRAIRALLKLGYIVAHDRKERQTGTLSIDRERVASAVIVTATEENSAAVILSDPAVILSDPAVILSDPAVTVTAKAREAQLSEKKRKSYANKFAEQDSELIEWIAFWNRLHSMRLVASSTSSKPNEGVVKSWKRVKKSKDLQLLLSDRKKVELAIKKSEFVRAGWFTLPKLLAGKNRDGEFIVQKLLDDGYLSSSSKRSIANVGDGVNFNPERDMTNAKF